jgi:hypothetical protein
MKILQLKEYLKQAQQEVKAIHNCPECALHLEAIKQHKARGHKP